MKSNKPAKVQAFNRIVRALSDVPEEERASVLQSIVLLFGEPPPELRDPVRIVLPPREEKPDSAA